MPRNKNDDDDGSQNSNSAAALPFRVSQTSDTTLSPPPEGLLTPSQHTQEQKRHLYNCNDGDGDNEDITLPDQPSQTSSPLSSAHPSEHRSPSIGRQNTGTPTPQRHQGHQRAGSRSPPRRARSVSLGKEGIRSNTTTPTPPRGRAGRTHASSPPLPSSSSPSSSSSLPPPWRSRSTTATPGRQQSPQMTSPAANDGDDDDDEGEEGQGTPFPPPGPPPYPAQPPPRPFYRTPSPPTQMLSSSSSSSSSSSPPTISPFRTPSPRTLAAHPPSPTHLAITLLKPSSASAGAHPAITLTLSTHRTALPTDDDDDDADAAIPPPWTPATAKAALQATLARITRILESYGVTRQEKRGPADVRGYYRMHSMSAWREYHGARNEDDGVVPTAWARCEVEVGFASCAAMMAVVGAVLGEGGRAGEGWRAKGFEGEFCDGLWEAEEERRRVGEETLEVLRGWHGVEVEHAGDDRQRGVGTGAEGGRERQRTDGG